MKMLTFFLLGYVTIMHGKTLLVKRLFVKHLIPCPGVKFLGTISKFREKITFPYCLFKYSIKREIKNFHVVLVQKRAKKCTKKRDALVIVLVIII